MYIAFRWIPAAETPISDWGIWETFERKTENPRRNLSALETKFFCGLITVFIVVVVVVFTY